MMIEGMIKPDGNDVHMVIQMIFTPKTSALRGVLLVGHAGFSQFFVCKTRMKSNEL